MDIIYQISIIAVFLPFLFAMFLLITKLRLANINKNVTNNGLGLICLTSLIIYIFLYLFHQTINFNYNFLFLDKFSLGFGFKVDNLNLKLLIFSALVYFIISIFYKKYFEKKKQFLFLKQRFYIIFSLLVFNTFLFLTSNTLFQMMVFWLLSGVIIFFFSYFDIFKNNTNFNILRFHRIVLIGDFAFVLLCLILLKYTSLSQGYIAADMLNLDELDILLGYTYGITGQIDLYLILFCIILAVSSKLFLFPFNCYYSFFANSSGLVYLPVLACSNGTLGIYFFLKMLNYIQLFEINSYIYMFLIFSIISSIFFILFEKNIKIIFGWLISIINGIILGLSFIYPQDVILSLFFIFNLSILGILISLFLKEKTTFKRALINKRKGFILEKIHIILFEKIPKKVQTILDFIDSKIVQNITVLLFNIFSYLAFAFVNKTMQNSAIKNSKNILAVFLIIVLLVVCLALFRGF